MPEPSLLERLKERKLVQWALAYLAGAFFVYTGLDPARETWGIPETVIRGVHILLIAGFFITLVLAWYHGEKGRQRVSGPELLMVAALLVVAGVALSLLGAGEGMPVQTGNTASLPLDDDRPSVAVLLCDNFSPNPEDAFRAQGIHEEILLRLQGISSLRSIGRTSVLHYADNPEPVPEIATALRVGFVGECSVLKDPDQSQIRVTFQLLDANGTQVWADSYDHDLTVENLLNIQSDIAQQIASAVGVALTSEEEVRIEKVPTENLEAYEAYQLGLFHQGRRDDYAESLPEALRFFQLAIQKDPDLAPAHAGMSHVFNSIASVGLSPPKDIWPQVERWARSGLALDSTLAEAHLQLAEASLVRGWDWGEAERRLKRAIRLDPNSPVAHTYYMNFLLAQARMQEAEREFEILAQLDPLSSATLNSRARFAFFARNFEDAVPLAEILEERDPTNLQAYNWLGLSLMVSGQLEEADRIYPVSFPELPKESALDWAALALYYSLTDAPDSAMATMDRVLSLSERDYVNPLFIWPTYAALGNRDEAFAWMERSIEAQSWLSTFLGVSPLADPLRDDLRFQTILDRISLGHLKARFDSLAAARPTGGP